MNLLLVLPILIPLIAAAAMIVAWRWPRLHRPLGVVGAAGVLLSGSALLWSAWNGGAPAVLVTQMGDWPAPFGVSLVADLLSAIMVVLTGTVGLAVAVYSLGSIDGPREAYGYHPLLQVLLMGVCGAFLTGDIFNLYVWFEVMLMASFVLLALGGERSQLEGAVKYVTLNLIASAIFLAAIGILYGIAGTLNLADLAQKLDPARLERPGLVLTVSMLFLTAFGIKAAVFPLFFWLPASYHTPPVAVSALFAGLLTKVGVYAIIRVFTLVFVQDPGYTGTLILAGAALTMVTGVLGAAAQHEFRRILSFHIVSQIGYMIMGLGLVGRTKSPELQTLALAGSIFYIVHHIIVKTNLFLVSGVAQRLGGSFELKKLGGLYRDHPGLAMLFLIPALSLAGVPPLSGFFAKLILIQAGLRAGEYLIVGVALAVGLLTLFSMMKIWAEAFWKARPGAGDGEEGAAPPAGPSAVHRPLTSPALLGPIAVFAAITVAIGLGGRPVFSLAEAAARQLLDRRAYIAGVLSERPRPPAEPKAPEQP
ncbi:MAG: Na+/H+ antiporter subunit D [Planctomycetales bacterium]